MHYSNADTASSAIFYEGKFSTSSVRNGKLVYLAFPFETIVDQTKREFLLNLLKTLESYAPIIISDFSTLILYDNQIHPITYHKIVEVLHKKIY